MTTYTLKQLQAARDAARITYAAAADTFRRAYVQLYAFDRLLAARGVDGSQGFGMVPAITWLRHSVANPGMAGSMEMDIRDIVENTNVEG